MDSTIQSALALLRGVPLLLALGFADPQMRPPAEGESRQRLDLALVLAVDVSQSMDDRQLAAQRDGYVAALRSPELAAAIASGATGRIAILYMEWSGPAHQVVVVPWVEVNASTGAARFADLLAHMPLAQPVAGTPSTSISGALTFAAARLAEVPASRRVIDISGNGPNNAGAPVVAVRDALVAGGITINGLPIALSAGGLPNGRSATELYYANCVIGGADSFVLAIERESQFSEVIRRKLVAEIVARRAGPAPAYRPAAAFDCSGPGDVPGR